MKLLYQHILSFLVVIITSVSIIGFSMINSEKNQAYQTNFNRLDGYAHNIERMMDTSNGSEPSLVTPEFLMKLTLVMRDENVKIFLLDKNVLTTYPETGVNILKPKYKKMLKNGQTLYIRDDHSNDQNFFASRAHSNNNVKGPITTVSYTWTVVPQFVKNESGRKFVGAVMIGSALKTVMRPVTMAKANLLRALLVTIIVGLLLSFIMAYYQTSKIKKLSKAAQQVAEGDFDVQVPHKDSDEIDDLAENFNEMVRALKESNEEVKAQEKRRDQFMQDVAHEMRTPLTTINGLLEGLQYNAIPEDSIPQSISLMQRETKRLIRLVNENLDYEKIRSGKNQLLKSNFNARTVLNDLIQQLKQNADKNNDKLVIDCPDRVEVFADHDRFTQIMVNLVQNAIQFTNDGQIIISGKRIEHGACFSVADNGIGMSPDQTKYIFERFYKADPARARYGGTGESGLGLSIVLSLVKQHGGDIEVKSKLHEGSVFTITLYDRGYEKLPKDD